MHEEPSDRDSEQSRASSSSPPPRPPRARRQKPTLAQPLSESESESSSSSGHEDASDTSPRSIRSEGTTDVEDDDLEIDLSTAVESPTKRQLYSQGLEKLKNRRASSKRNLPGGPVVDIDEEQSEEMEDMEFATAKSHTSVSSDDDIRSETGTSNGVDIDDDFIVPDNESQSEHIALPQPQNRELEAHFKVYIQYLIHISLNPNILQELSTDNEMYFQSAINAITDATYGMTHQIAVTTWLSPFRCTLELRPHMKISTIESCAYECDACWQRGKFGCCEDGMYTLTTEPGKYNPATFNDEPESIEKDAFTKQTCFENRALAPRIPYPPNFELSIGSRCARKATYFHEAFHYRYYLFQMIKDTLDELCDDSEGKPSRDADADKLFSFLEQNGHITPLWEEFEQLREEWRCTAGVHYLRED